MVCVYAHQTTAGWATLIEAVRRAGFVVVEAWPLDTEMPVRGVAQGTASLASSIFLVARPRVETRIGDWAHDVRPELQEIVAERVDELAELGITGTDLVIAAIGAGMRAYTRFARVEKPNGEELAPDEYLDEVEREVAETILARIFGTDRGGLGRVDQETQFYVMGRFEFGDALAPWDELNTLARGTGVELSELTTVASALVAFGKKRSEARLRDYTRAWRARSSLGARRSTIFTASSGSPRTSPSGVQDYLDAARPDAERLRLVAQALSRPGLDSPAHGARRPRRASACSASGSGSIEDNLFTARRRMKDWTDVVRPHDDILAATSRWPCSPPTSARSFAATARVREVYGDPRAFFRATYLTSSMRTLLATCSARSPGGGGDRVLQLRTPFGGGKTHTLLALYHLATARESAQRLADLAGLPDPGPTRVAVLSGVDLDPSSPRAHDGVVAQTLWGELAWQLGGADAYRLVAAQDERGQAPGKDVLARSSPSDEPTLLLLDEVLVYVEKAKALPRGDTTLGSQVLLFLQALTELVGAHARAAMVYSLQKSVLEAAGDESLLLALDHLVTRVDAKREPVIGDEVMRVVQRRLFADLGSEEDARRGRARLCRSLSAATDGSSPTRRRSAGTPTPRRSLRRADPRELPVPSGAARPHAPAMDDAPELPAHARRAPVPRDCRSRPLEQRPSGAAADRAGRRAVRRREGAGRVLLPGR